MLIAILCTSTSATAYDFEVDGIAYTITSLTDLTVCVDHLTKKDTTKINIPENVEYKSKKLTVTSLNKGAFTNNNTLSEVILPNTITSIGDEAFYNCINLKNINLNSNLKSIGDKAFYNCINLRNINFNSNLKSIGIEAFAKSGLISIEIPTSISFLGDGAFKMTRIKKISLPDNIRKIPNYCFQECRQLQYVMSSSSLSRIESHAFENCILLKHISLPILAYIGEYAFSGCTKLEEFTLSAFKLEPSILWNCPRLTKLTIGSHTMGLPYKERDWGDRRTITAETLGYCYKLDTRDQRLCEGYAHLTGIKRFIIEDSDEPFSIKNFFVNTFGYQSRAPFSDLNLNYYYVGRPLKDITKWTDYYGDEHKTTTEQGTGKIKKLEIGGYCTEVPYFYQAMDTLKLGAKIKRFELENLYKFDIVKIECLATTPPECTGYSTSDFPTNVYTDAILYVPYGSKEAYAKAEVWKNFWNIYELENNESGVTTIKSDQGNSKYCVYSLTGILIGKSYSMEDVHNLPKGIYILINGSKRFKIKV